MPTPTLYAAYLTARYRAYSVDWTARPIPAKVALDAVRRNEAPRNTLRIGKSDGTATQILWPAADLLARGFDPEHTTIKVSSSPDDFGETILDRALESLQMYGEAGRATRGWSDRDEAERNRPHPWATLLDLSTPRDRSTYYWVTVPEKDADAEAGGRPKGMSRGMWGAVRQAECRRITAGFVEWAREVLHEDRGTFNVDVKVYWRGEEIGFASLGGCDLAMRGFDREVLDIVTGNGLVFEALADAEVWAEGAVAVTQQQAAALVGGVALLPARSLRPVDNVKVNG